MTAPNGTQPVAPPPLDTGNQLLGETPANLTTAVVNTPAGQRMALTVRTASTTLTLFLAKDDAGIWGEQIKAAASGMSGLILAGAGAVPAP